MRALEKAARAIATSGAAHVRGAAVVRRIRHVAPRGSARRRAAALIRMAPRRSAEKGAVLCRAGFLGRPVVADAVLPVGEAGRRACAKDSAPQ